MWKGAINFGLVSVPVKLYTATTDNETKFSILHAPCKSKVRYEVRCLACDQPVGDDKTKGYIAGNTVVEITEEELDALPVPTKQTVTIERFVPADQVDPVFFEKTYTVLPEVLGVGAFRLIVTAMAERGLLGIGSVTLRSRESVCALRAHEGGGLSLHLLKYADEVKPREFVQGPEIREDELALALQVLDSMTADFEPFQYRDHYRDAVHDMVQAKLNGNGAAPLPEAARPAPTVDIMQALRAMLQQQPASKPSAPITSISEVKAKRPRRAASK